HFGSSTTNDLTQTVTPADTSVSLSSDLSQPGYGTAITISATVGVQAPGAGTPSSGTVLVFEGNTEVGTGTLNSSSVATLTTSWPSSTSPLCRWAIPSSRRPTAAMPCTAAAATAT